MPLEARGGRATKVPLPGIRSSSPSDTKASMAWRTVIRATPKRWTRTRSEGAGEPGASDAGGGSRNSGDVIDAEVVEEEKK